MISEGGHTSSNTKRKETFDDRLFSTVHNGKFTKEASLKLDRSGSRIKLIFSPKADAKWLRKS